MVFFSISGERLAKLLEARCGYVRDGQRGSHVKLSHPQTGHVIVIPAHRELKRGTLNGVLADISGRLGVSKLDLVVTLRRK